MDTSISFSKIVSTPTLNSWSQVYNAGKLFAVLSLEKNQNENQDTSPLNIQGKDLLERLEKEFFTIEVKDLDSIKKAILNTFSGIDKNIIFSFVCGFVNDNILYLFIAGKGDVFIKRGQKIGNVLRSLSENLEEIASSSGFLSDNDLIILATNSFSSAIDTNILNPSLESNMPSEITESLAPKIHKIEDGRLAAIVIKYSVPKEKSHIPEVHETDSSMNETLKPDLGGSTERLSGSAVASKYLSLIYSKIKFPYRKFGSRRKLFLIIPIVAALVLVLSIFLTIKKQNSAKMAALFNEIYPTASKKYEEGHSLLDLNKNLAKESFLTAQKILNDNKDKFPAKSKQALQIQELLKKIDSGLAESSPVDKSGLDRSKLSLTVTNGSGIEGTASKATSILKKLGYENVSTGNADNYNYEGVTIKVKSSKKDFLELLKKDLSKEYTISETSSDLSSDFSTDALIIIGK